MHWSDAKKNGVTTPREPARTSFVDSGADDHICHPEFAKESPSKKSAGLTLRDVQGTTLSHHGTRNVNLTVGTQGRRANIDCQVADISDDILSLGKLLRNGFVFRLNVDSESIKYHRADPTTTVPLFLHKKSLRIHATPLIHRVRLVADDDIPVKLSSRSPTNLLHRRLDEWAPPKESTLLVIAFLFLFFSRPGSVSGVVADEGATFLVLVEVDNST